MPSAGGEHVAGVSAYDVPRCADQVTIDHFPQQWGIIGCVGDKSAPIPEPSEENGIGGSLALVHHGVGLDRRLPLCDLGNGRSLVVVDRCLIDRGVPRFEWPRGGFSGVIAGGLLGEVLAVGGNIALVA